MGGVDVLRGREWGGGGEGLKKEEGEEEEEVVVGELHCCCLGGGGGGVGLEVFGGEEGVCGWVSCGFVGIMVWDERGG